MYEAPKVKVVGFRAERGFATSENGVFNMTGNPVEMNLLNSNNENTNANEKFGTNSAWENAF